MTSTSSSTNKIGGFDIKHLLNTAEQVVQRKTQTSNILDIQAEARIPKFQFNEVTLGRVLGRGGFCVVNEITKIQLQATEAGGSEMPSNSNHTNNNNNNDDDEHHLHNVVQDRAFMQKYCIRQGKDCRYAMKRVQDSSRKEAQLYVNAVVDLAVEARFLSVLRHGNIIKMRAMSIESPYSDNFFVVLDRLYDILSTRVTKWKKSEIKGVKKLLDRKGKKELAFWVERCTVAYDLSCALKFLHDINIIYRDLKPDNIGFDVRGDVKIFDFGLAKEFVESERDADGLYKLTGDTGSPRYMAPEVAMERPYNETVDVYSFCILLWQILKMETPFEGYNMSMFRKKVVSGGARPKCDPKWPEEICNMMRNGWNADISKRPSMEDVSAILRDEINKNTDEEVYEIMDASRKSEMSLRGQGM